MTNPRHAPALVAGLFLLASCGGGGGGGGGGTSAPPPQTWFDPVAYSTAAGASLASAQELAAVTRHQAILGGVPLAYTATAGHLTARQLVTGAPQASFFYVAYTLEGASPATRPVTFFYNGGPGSATIWLHLGSYGPKRLATNAPSTATPTPFALVDNAESLLDVSDLVFVDAVGAGLSQAIAPNTNQTFWSVDADAAAFRDFVRRYVEANGRAASPKFLFGESYGTTRSAVLANLLESAGVPLAGVVLLSSILDYNSNCGVLELPLVRCTGHLPSYAATGAWFHRASPDPGAAGLPAFLARSREVATTQYDPALRGLLESGVPPGEPLLDTLAGLTGLTTQQWRSNFNLRPDYFRASLIGGSVLGGYDARMTAPSGSAGDPSSTFIAGQFAAAIGPYLATLQYTNPSSYVTLSNAIQSWNFIHGERSLPDTVPDLAAAMAINPRLKVLSAGGHHDVVTPFHQTEIDLRRFGGHPNIVERYHPGGHMTYLDDASRVLQKADLAQFYAGALGTPAPAKRPGAARPPAPPAPQALPAMQNPPALAQVPMLDPWVPPAVAAKAVRAAPSTGAAFRAQVEARLRGPFEAADRDGSGTLTREEARAAGLGYIEADFDRIDTRASGAVRFEDVKAFLRGRGAALD